MADTSLFTRLKRLFSNDIVVRNIGGTEIKVADVNHIQTTGRYQTNSMIDRFSRLYISNNKNIFNPNLNYQTLRIQLYSDYEAMDSDPIIASALDIVADEATLRNEQGDVLSIRSSDENIQRVLENLFYDILNIEFNLWSWTRNVCKYGDFFLKLEIAEKFGIYNVLPYTVYHMVRREGEDPEKPTKVTFQLDPDGLASSQDPNYIPKDNRRVIQFDNYEIAHFRLLSDTNYLPYGRSYLEPARKIFKQVTLMEDAMLIHRIMRAPEKRMFYINVGQIPPAEVEQFMQKTISTMKKTPYIGQDGQYNLKFNMQNMMEDFYIPVRGGDTTTKIETTKGLEYDGTTDVQYLQAKLFAALKVPKAYFGFEGELCVVPETEITLLDGRTKTVAEIIEEYEKGIQNYTYSVDEETGDIVPGKITWAGYTRKNAELVRVELDNGRFVDTTPDHLFLTRDGIWVEAQNLCEGTSLMPLYLDEDLRGYTTVYNPRDGKYKQVHRVVAEHYGYVEKGRGKVVHHVDFNKYNNNPENLNCTMGFYEHRKFHQQQQKRLVEVLRGRGYYDRPEYRQQQREKGKKGGIKSAEKLGEYSRTHRPWNYIGPRCRVCPGCGKEFLSTSTYQKFCGIDCYKVDKVQNKEKYFTEKNNKRYFISKEELLEVASKARNFVDIQKHFNITRNTLIRLLGDFNLSREELVQNVMLESHKNVNFYNNFRYKNHKVKSITFLGERKDTCDLHIENYHNFGTAAGVIIHNSGKATLSAEDIRFARTVERIQRIMESELTKIALIHLYVQGFTGESLTNFEIKLTTPSIIFEQEKIALYKEKIDLANQMLDSKLFSSDYIYDKIFNLSEDEYTEMRGLLREDAKRNFRLAQIENEGNDPALSGKSYGTPHDLASMYGRRSSPTVKGAALGEVPKTYEERPRITDSGPEGGRPRTRMSVYGTQENPVGGADPIGRYGMHGPYESDPEYVNENQYLVEEKRTVFTPTEEDSNLGSTLLDEDNLSE